MSAAFDTFRDGREVCREGKAGLYEYVLRTMQMANRQGWRCAICRRKFESADAATFDHQGGRGMNGGKRDDRIELNGCWQNAAVCMGCNSAKGSKRYRWVDGSYRPVEKAA